MIVNLKQKLFAESHDSENFETFDTNIEKLINITITDENADFRCLRVVFLEGVEHISVNES